MQKRINTVTSTEAILKLLMFFAILTVFQDIPAFSNINKVWMVGLVFVLALRLFAYRYSTVEFMMLCTLVLLHICAICYTEFPLEHVNMLFYFALWVLLYLFFFKSKNRVLYSLSNSKQYIEIILWIWTIPVGISALFPFGYNNNYFVSFTSSSFRFMPTTLLVLALTMYLINISGNKRYELFMILPTYAAFNSNSRTYFGVYILFLMMYIYMRMKSKKTFYLMLIPMFAVIIGAMTVSGIMDKVLATQYTEKSYFDYWGTLTSGRSVFWRWDLEAFFGLPFWQQFVGNGFNFVYDVNGANMERIWAHNDIINLLMNFGYIGVVIYLWSYFKLTRTYMTIDDNVPLLVRVIFHGAVFINSMMNMSYTYLCAMISYPLFLCAISAKYDKK